MCSMKGVSVGAQVGADEGHALGDRRDGEVLQHQRSLRPLRHHYRLIRNFAGANRFSLATRPSLNISPYLVHRSAALLRLLTAACGRFCCKSLFALVITNSFGCTHDFRVKMWGTSWPEDKPTGDLGNVIEATSIGGRRVGFFYS